MDFSLDRIHHLLTMLPRYTRPTFHVAGTNGKGSVTVILDSILRQSGLRTGRFNSPHLVHYRDSISIDGHSVSQLLFDNACLIVDKADVEGRIEATNFERLTAVALYILEEAAVDVAIVEVGMGGRLDATNAIPEDVVLACGLASVDLDHQAFLGHNVEDIAREKAAIAKPGVPCVLGVQMHPSVSISAQKTAESKGAKFVLAQDVVQVSSAIDRAPNQISESSVSSFEPPNPQSFRLQVGESTLDGTLALQGRHQMDNVRLAVAMIRSAKNQELLKKVTCENIARGISEARWPGRLEWIWYQRRTLWILADGAHNVASATALASYLDAIPVKRPRRFILSMSHSPPKTPREVFEPLLAPGDRVAIVPFENVEGMPWVHPVPIEVFASSIKGILGDTGTIKEFPNLSAALESPHFIPNEGADPVIISGSLYLIGDLHRVLG